MIDALGHPITAGDTVLTNAYYSCSMTEITSVDRTTEKAVYVTIQAHSWHYDEKLKQGVHTSYKKQMRRRPDQVLVITKQLEHNQTNYPENMI
jgi:hypothetical protein